MFHGFSFKKRGNKNEWNLVSLGSTLVVPFFSLLIIFLNFFKVGLYFRDGRELENMLLLHPIYNIHKPLVLLLLLISPDAHSFIPFLFLDTITDAKSTKSLLACLSGPSSAICINLSHVPVLRLLDELRTRARRNPADDDDEAAAD